MNESLVLFILVYFASATKHLQAADPAQGLNASKIQMDPGDAIQYLKFHDVSYNLTDFTICTWIRLSNFSHTQTIFRLTGNKKETVMSWQVHARPKETMKMTIKNRLVASEVTRLAAGGRWNHVCFQWNGFTGVWAIFVNAKIHSVGQTPTAGNNTSSSGTHGKGAGIVGDDAAPCRNGWQAYGLYMTGPANGAPASPSANTSAAAAVKNNSKRQAVYESDSDGPSAGGATPQKPFQWLSKTFAFIKRAFTFVIIPFFKFVRNTFFQTRSMDDTVVDVSETHLTVSEVKFAASPTTTPTTANTSMTIVVESLRSDDTSGHVGLNDGDGDEPQRRSSKRETTSGGDGCAAAAGRAHNDRVTTSDLLDVGTQSDTVKRYLRTVSDGLNDVGVTVAFVRRTFACCRRPSGNVAAAVDWDTTRYTAHGVTVSPHVCRSTA